MGNTNVAIWLYTTTKQTQIIKKTKKENCTTEVCNNNIIIITIKIRIRTIIIIKYYITRLEACKAVYFTFL